MVAEFWAKINVLVSEPGFAIGAACVILLMMFMVTLEIKRKIDRHRRSDFGSVYKRKKKKRAIIRDFLGV